MNSFLGDIVPLLKLGFKKPGKGKQSLNAAYTFNYPHALLLNEGHYEIDYPKIVYSRGHISGPAGVQVTAVSGIPPNELETLSPNSDKGIAFSWRPQEQSGFCRFDDRATVLVYNPLAAFKAMFSIGLTDRYSLGCSLAMPLLHSGQTAYCYISFSSADGKLQGNSRYVGTVVCL